MRKPHDHQPEICPCTREECNAAVMQLRNAIDAMRSDPAEKRKMHERVIAAIQAETQRLAETDGRASAEASNGRLVATLSAIASERGISRDAGRRPRTGAELQAEAEQGQREKAAEEGRIFAAMKSLPPEVQNELGWRLVAVIRAEKPVPESDGSFSPLADYRRLIASLRAVAAEYGI